MSFWRFLGNWFREAFHCSWHAGHIVHQILVFLFGLLALLSIIFGIGAARGEEPEMLIAAPLIGAMLVFLAGFVWYAYRLYREEYDSRLELVVQHDKELAELRKKYAEAEALQAQEVERLQQMVESKRPKLVANMEQLVFGVTPNEEQFHTFILMGIRNAGGPSIAHEWSIRANLPDGRCAAGALTWIDHMELFEGMGPARVISPEQSVRGASRIITKADAIYNKAMTPIPTGGKIVGWLSVLFSGFSREELGAIGTEFIVGFKDVLDAQCSCSHTLAGPFTPLGKAPRYAGE
jgi:hypothetical protein